MDECKPLLCGCEQQPDGSFRLLLGASAASSDEWGQRHMVETTQF